jgi:glycosyltransferase involved in cell wall biosynthesis
VLASLFDALAPASVRAYEVDATTPAPPVGAGGVRPVRSLMADLADRVAADAPSDVVLVSGRPNWHAVDAVARVLTSRVEQTPRALVVEGSPRPPLSDARERAHVHEVEREETVKAGIGSALAEYAARLGPGSILLSVPDGRGFWAALRVEQGSPLEAWVEARAELLEALDTAHRERAAYLTQCSELVTLLERSQRSAAAVVRSRRFGIGTRAVRLARRLSRREEFFPAPSRILHRQATVDRWSERYGSRERPTVAVAPGALRVTYVLPDLRRSGGGLAVSQLVNDLRLLGVDARVATLRVRGESSRVRLLAPPLQFDSEADLVRRLPEADVIVATHWSSASVVRAVLDRDRRACGSYLIQDYEAWFYPESDQETRARVRATYGLIPNRVVTSSWLRDLVENDGFDATKITSGVDLDIYYPRSAPAARPLVLAMARPRTPRRGFETLVEALTRLHRQQPEAEIVLFGQQIRGMKLPFPFRGLGVISDPDRLARLYSRARAFVDTSDFQAFGRAALEAMACGAVPVLTSVGGVGEYAADGRNAVLVGPRDPVATADAVARIVTDESLHARLREAGRSTVRAHSAHRDALATLEHFRRIASGGA